MAPKSDLTRVLQKIGELNLKQGTSAFSKFGCKNEGYVRTPTRLSSCMLASRCIGLSQTIKSIGLHLHCSISHLHQLAFPLSFVTAMVLRGTELHRDSFEVRQSRRSVWRIGAGVRVRALRLSRLLHNPHSCRRKGSQSQPTPAPLCRPSSRRC